MSRAKVGRAKLIEAITQVGRAHSTATVMLHSAIAERFELSATDWKCAEIIHRVGAMTAGRLAELSGLTTGAITGVVDRLEQKRLVRRGNDPNDRRRVIIHPLQEREDEAIALFSSLQAALQGLYARYSDEELALILDYIRGETEVMEGEALRMRREDG